MPKATRQASRVLRRRAKIARDDCRDCTKPREAKAVEYVVKHQILREKILPDVEIFHPREVDDIYVTRRVPSSYSLRGEIDEFADSLPKDDPSPQRPAEDYEQRFYREFWRHRREQIIFLVGNRGCGKSTFLEHFLRSDCPTVSADDEAGIDYRFKLKVRVNLRSVESADFADQFYKQARTSIRRAFRSRCEQDDYPAGRDQTLWRLDNQVGFWTTALSLDNCDQEDLYKKRAAKDGVTYETQVLAQSKLVPVTPDLWVEYALAFFEQNQQYFRYLVIVLDNLDQSSRDTQRTAIRCAQSLVKNSASLSLFKLIIPLWPSSHDSLCRAMKPLNDESVLFELPGLDINDYYEKRFRQEIGDISDNDPDVQELTTWAQNYAQDFYMHCRKTFFLFFDNFAGSDIRFRQELVLSVLANPTMIRRYRSSDDSDFSTIGEYLNFSSLIAGPCDAHHRDLSPIANLFYASSSEETESNLLIGMHLLWFLDYRRGLKLRIDDVHDFLAGIGHGHHDIEESVDYFERKELLTITSVFGDMPGEYFINRTAVDSYIYLAGCLGYLDNMAMVTPVSEQARSDISRTTGSQFFKERKLSTLAFLDEVRRVEVAYLSSHKGRRAVDMISYLGRNELPSVYLTLRDRYAVNDNEQRKKQVSHVLSKRVWKELTERLNKIDGSSKAFFEDYEPWEPYRRSLPSA